MNKKISKKKKPVNLFIIFHTQQFLFVVDVVSLNLSNAYNNINIKTKI